MPLELGSDTGGSLRAPAHYCGVFSHKPSLDLIPPRGAGYPETPAIAARGELFVIGPMARSAADLALALSVLAGPDEMWDGIGYKLALPEPRHDSLADYRVLLIDAHPLCPTAVSIKEALEGLTDHLAKFGCTIVRASPKMPDLALSTRNYIEFRLALLSADLPPDERARIEAAANALSPDDQSPTAARLRSSTMSHAAWVRTNRIRRRAAGAMAGSVSGCRCHLVSADADHSVSARSLTAEDEPTRRGWQEDTVLRPIGVGGCCDLDRTAGDDRPDRARRRAGCQ